MRSTASSPTLDRLAPWLAAGALALAAAHPIYNPDTFGNMAAGREILQLGHVPSVDHFSLLFDQPRPWRNHNWLSGLALFVTYDALGVGALVVLGAALVALSGAWLVRCARDAGLGGAAMACALVQVAAIPAIRIRLSARPHLFALLCEVLLLVALDRISAAPSTRPRWRWLSGLFVLQVAWLNLHGSSLFGVALTLGYLLVHARTPAVARELACMLGLQLLASCASPWGPAVLLESVAHVGDPAIGATLSEWAPFDASDPPWYLASLIAQGALLALAAPALVRHGPRLLALLGVGVVTWLLALRSSRFILEALLLGAPAVALGVSRALARMPTAGARALAVASAAAAVVAAPVAAARLPPFLPVGFGLSTMVVPAGAGAWLARHHPRARIAANMQDGWYMSFAVPHSRVLLDGRVAVYGLEGFARAHAALGDAVALRRMLDERRVDAVVLPHAAAAFRVALAGMQRDERFRLVLLEDRHALFVRRTIAPAQPAFEHLSPGYSDAASSGASAELARLAPIPSSRGYHAYHAALASLSHDLRDGGRSGLTLAEDAAARARIERALPLLRIAAERVPEVALIHVHHALVAAHACRLDEAREALALAAEIGESREQLLTAQEIALRARDLDAVRAFLASIAGFRAERPDPWVDAIEHALSAPPRCP